MNTDLQTCVATCTIASKSTTYKHCVTNCVTEDDAFLNIAGNACIDLTNTACTVLNYAQTECEAACTANTEAVDGLKICRKCVYFMPFCLECSDNSTCTKCDSGAALKTTNKCAAFCPAGQYLAGAGSTYCLANCDANPHVAGNNYIASSLIICTNACGTDEYSTATPNTCHKCASNLVLSNTNITMQFCAKCSAEKTCTECLVGYLWTDDDGAGTDGDIGCASSCQGDTPTNRGFQSSVSNKCIDSCEAGTIPLAQGDEADGTLHLKCVADCWAADKQFKSQDGSICTNKCNEFTLNKATAEYPDYTDASHPQCKFCKDKDPNCVKCIWDTAWKCELCDSSGGTKYYLSTDKLHCVEDCYVNDGNHYPIVIKTVGDDAYYMCIVDCFDNNQNFARDVSGKWSCVEECLSTEFAKFTTTPKYTCTLCSARKDIGGAVDLYFENCDACTSVDVCTLCSVGFIRYNNAGCIQHCADDMDFGTTPSYEGSDGKHCWTSCKNKDDNRAINTQLTACTDTCAAEAYLDTSGSDNQCILCDSKMSHCIACTSATVCTTCEAPYYLKVSKTGCVASCSANDNSYAKSGGVRECVSACANDEYSNAGICEKCDMSANQVHCIKCTSSINCLQCDTIYFATAFPGAGLGCKTSCSSEGSYLENLATPLKCVASCASSEFVNTQNKCQSCSNVIPDCLSCSSMYSCNQCDTNSLNKYRSSDSKSCVAVCGDYATLDSTSTICEACNVNVAGCLACTLQGATVKCIKCNYGYLTINSTCTETCLSPYINLKSLLNNNAGNICTANCPSGTIYQNSTNSCEACHAYCKTCSQVNDETKCITCIDTMYQSGIYCVVCPEGYYWDDNRKECAVACQDKYYKNNDTRTCDPCHSNCQTCNGPKNNQCTSCSGLVLLSGICAEYNQETCPVGQYLVYTINEANCVVACPAGMYADDNSQTCENCDTTCATCTSGNSYACKSCTSPRIFNEVQNTCVKECPEGTYQTVNNDTNTTVCKICNSGCKKCEQSSSNCQSCEIGYYLYQSNCITTCKSGYYAKTSPRECALCNEACLTCVGGFSYACLTCNSSAGLILISELDEKYGSCKNKVEVLNSIESESNNFNEDNYVTSFSVANQANVIRDALITVNLSNSTLFTSSTKAVQQFTSLASKRSSSIESSTDALYFVDAISQLNNISSVSTDDSLTNSIETLNNVIENENVPMDQSLFGKVISSWSNLYERNSEVVALATSSASQTKIKKRDFNAKLAQYNDVLINSLKIAILGSSDEQLEFTAKSNKINAKIKKVNNKVAQTLNLDVTREELMDRLRERILSVKRGLEECQEITNIGQPLVKLDNGCMIQLPAQTLLVQFVNYQMNVFSKYTYAKSIKSNVVLYTIIDGSTQKATTIEGAESGYLTVDIPLQELICDSDNELVCVRWDDQIKDWNDEGIATVSTTDLYVQCQTRKLGYFAIIEREKFTINREVKKNYGFMSVWFILIFGVAMGIGETKSNNIDPSNFSEYEQFQYKLGKIRKFSQSIVPLTINPILSIFLSQKMNEFIKKIIQFGCYIMSYMFYLSIFYNIEEWNITDDLYLMVPLPLLSIFITWVCNYIIGFIKMKFDLPIYAAIAFIYYAGMSIGISFEMKGSTDDRSHKFAYSALLGLAIDLIIFDGILILLAKVLNLPRKMVWSFFIMDGFAEDEFMPQSRAKQIIGEEGQKLENAYKEQPNVEITNQQEIEQQEIEQQEIQQVQIQQEIIYNEQPQQEQEQQIEGQESNQQEIEA